MSDLFADAPTAVYLFPAGGQLGTTVEVRVGGCDLFDGCAMEVTGNGIVASPRTWPATQTLWFEGPVIPLPDSQAKETYPKDHLAKFSIASTATLGMRQVFLSNSQGISNPLRFVIGDLNEIVEEEIEGTPIPTQVTLPLTINGRIFPREDRDLWTFDGKAGTSYLCRVEASRFGSPLESQLIVRGPDGTIVADSIDRSGPDAWVQFVAPSDGCYQVQIHDVHFGGLQHYVYRLTITDRPYISNIYPLGGRRGTKVLFELSGQRVPSEPIERELPKQISEVFRAPFLFDGFPSNPVLLELSDCDEAMEKEPNDEPSKSFQGIASVSPSVLNGRIDRAGDMDFWPLTLKKGDEIQLDVHAAALGSQLDSVLTLFDDSGNSLVTNDDKSNNQADSSLSFKVLLDGIYWLSIRDRFDFRGGQGFAYRIHVNPKSTEPTFELFMASEFLNVPRGGQVKTKVSAIRKNGLSGKIALHWEGLPDGVTIQGNEIPDKKNDIDVLIKASPQAEIGKSKVRVQGSVTIGEHIVARYAARPQFNGADLSDEFVSLAIAMPTPFKIKGTFETKYAARGSTYLRRYSIDRGGFDGPITIGLAERQVRHLQGVTGPTLVVPPKETEFEYPIHLPPWMEIGRTSRTCLMGVADIADERGVAHRVSFTSQEQFDQIIVLVDPGQLDLRLERNSLRAIPKSHKSLKVSLGRGQGLDGDVRVELLPPNHLRWIRAEPLIIPAGSHEGWLSIHFDEELRDPITAPLIVRATATVQGRPYTSERKLTVVTDSSSFQP